MITTPSKISGTVSAPPSKSYAIRYLFASFLSGEKTLIKNVGSADDVNSAVSAVTALGASCSFEGEDISVAPAPLSQNTADCGESATVYRFLLAIAAAKGINCNFTLAQSLQKRANNEYIALLKAHGAAISATYISGKLKSGRYIVSGEVSTQYLSALILALPLVAGDSEIIADKPLCDSPYVKMTLKVVQDFGVIVRSTEYGFYINGGQKYISPKEITVEGDYSGAANLLVLGALSGEVTVTSLLPESLQPDKKIIDILRDFGAQVTCAEDAVTVKKSRYNPVIADFSQNPDLVPAVSALCAKASGESILKCVSRLKYKETDRIASIISSLSAVGVSASFDGQDLHVFGGDPRGAVFPATDDHRTLMLQTLLASSAQGDSKILNATCVNKSYPDFFADYKTLGGLTDE